MTGAVLETMDLTATYGDGQVLHGVSLSVGEGGVTAVLGANGAGKTTLLRAVCGMVKTDGGVHIHGQDVSGWAPEEIVRLGVGHVPDGRGTFLTLSTEENLHVGAYMQRDRQGIAADLDRVYEYFPRLKERRRQQAGTLSGGEQQMLAIARALMSRPRLLLLDEPSFGLAPLVVAEIFRIMRRINEEQSVAILLVEQNAAIALDLADQVFLLETGRVVVSGSPDVIRGHEDVRRAYLGY
jgi:branched-chain amino acid transport system ATP-binding protein